MNDWASKELVLLRSCWPTLVQADGTNWCKIPNFTIPVGWTKLTADVAFHLPENLPGQEPYAFLVEGGIGLIDGTNVTNYTYPVETTPWGGPWGQFSWNLDAWCPGPEPGRGSSMVDFVRSISHRLAQFN